MFTLECVSGKNPNVRNFCLTDCGPSEGCSPDDDCNPDDYCNPDNSCSPDSGCKPNERKR